MQENIKDFNKMNLSLHLKPADNFNSRWAFPKPVSEEQEQYAKGFVDALHELRCGDSSQGVSFIDGGSSSNSITTYTDLDPTEFPSGTSFPLDAIVKDEPQMMSHMLESSVVSPINMEKQEVIKLERKRERNRMAASKCRTRKLERIAKLEERVKNLKGENSDLAEFLAKLRNQVSLLKGEFVSHVNSGCVMNYC